MDPQIGQIINNKYRLVRLIGDGGMGSVFEAKHELLGTTVALKFLHTALSRRKGLVDRFLQEAQVSARIKSTNVVRVSDVDRTPDGLAYMVMEYVEGKTLQALYEDLYNAGKRLSYGDAFSIMLQLLDGVAAAHTQSIVHRDLKPDNVMISRDNKGRMLVKILDFGIAKLKTSGEMERGLTRPGVVMGTPEYMAPEQAFSADKVDARADIFSLGVMFFEMLAGRRPVGGDNAHAIAAQYLEGKVSQLRDLKASIAEELAVAVHRAMAAEPKERFETVADFRKAIETFSPTGPGDGITQPSIDLAEMLDMDGDEDSDMGVLSSVPKTVPPEETFSGAPPEVAAVSSGRASVPSSTPSLEPAPESSELQTRVAPAMTSDDLLTESVDPLGDTKDGGEGAISGNRISGVGAGAAQGDAAAAQGGGAHGGTEAMPAIDPAAMAARAGTEAMPPDAMPGGSNTLVDDGEGAPMGGTGAMAAVPPMAGYVPPRPAAAPRGRGGRRSGPSIFTILFIAAAVAGAVVGGVYLAHEASEKQDAGDDPPVLQLQPKPPKPKPKTKPTSKTKPEPGPVVVPPPVSPTPRPPRPRPPTPRPPGPGPGPAPTPQPPNPGGFPTMLPSQLPFPTGFPTGFPPFPGQQQPPSPQPQPGPSPTPPSPGPKPRPTIPKIKFPLPKK